MVHFVTLVALFAAGAQAQCPAPGCSPPLMCSGMWDPQCGCDGEQYGNACEATCVSPTPNPSGGACAAATGDMTGITFNHCLPGEGMIESEAECVAAATSIGANYASSAGSEWASGCLWHNGNIYYSAHEEGSKVG